MEQRGTSEKIRSLLIEAPWGKNGITVEMNDASLGRFIGYLESLIGNENEQEQRQNVIRSGFDKSSSDCDIIVY